MKKKEFKGLDLISYDVDMNVHDLTKIANRILESKGGNTAFKKSNPSILGQIDTSDVVDQEMYNEIMKQNRSLQVSNTSMMETSLSQQTRTMLPLFKAHSRSSDKKGQQVESLLSDNVVAKIPINKHFKESNFVDQPPEVLEKCLRDEYAARYLEKLNISVTQKNLKIVNNILPITHCVAHKHRTPNNELYLSFTPQPHLVAGKCGTNASMSLSGLTPTRVADKAEFEYRVMEIMDKEMSNLNFQAIANGEPNKTSLVEEKGSLQLKPEESNHPKTGLVNKEGKLTVPKFEEYKKYIYPYNLIREKFMLDGEKEEMEQSIYERHQYNTMMIERSRMARMQSFLIKDSNRSLSRSNLRMKDTFEETGRSKSVLGKNNTNQVLDFHFNEQFKFDEKELEKTPHLSSFEIVELQNSFFEEFPFQRWNWISEKQKRSIAKDITDIKLTTFIKVFIEFCYWTFLQEFSKEVVDRYDLEKRFLSAYEDLIEDFKKFRGSKIKVTTNHPIILLCIRVTTESTLRICYQTFCKTKYFLTLCYKMSSLVSFLFDPDSDVLSKLPPIESNAKERKIIEKLSRITRKDELVSTKRKANSVSPVMTSVLLSSPLRDKNLEFSDNLSKRIIKSVVSVLSEDLRAKLMNIYMKKSK
ncbi:hypothetical protein C9374_001301 [Naegleria lovaniensis]|uniref:Uncharacterized protein n=1 Tax=Naegleria lovaniensis TaxID=51637 RepID=A0AA88GVF0_NAELO|nr:uncharacterized protein C9374_001301 [Naegleria lovaniensis]KAG2387707.1 hypothetical protein C9374_001301 [Naegleria lovaniensis]